MLRCRPDLMGMLWLNLQCEASRNQTCMGMGSAVPDERERWRRKLAS